MSPIALSSILECFPPFICAKWLYGWIAIGLGIHICAIEAIGMRES